jgi:hypothetical protein
MASTDPPHDTKLTETIDVVGMKMGQEDSLELTGLKSNPAEIPCRTGPRVDEIERTPRNDDHAGRRASAIWKRSPRAAKRDVQTVWQVADRIGQQTMFHGDTHHPKRDCTAEQPDDEDRSDGDDQDRK